MGRFSGTDLPYTWGLRLLRRALAKEGTERGVFAIMLTSDYSSDMDDYYDGEDDESAMDVYFDGHKVESPTPEFRDTLEGWVASAVIEIIGRTPYDAFPFAIRSSWSTANIPLPGETIRFKVTEFGEREVKRWIAEEERRPSQLSKAMHKAQ